MEQKKKMADEADQAQKFIETNLANALGKFKRDQHAISLKECEECGTEIPEARRVALAGVRLCVDCQEDLENA